MQLTRITATLGAVVLGGVLVASTTSVGASAPASTISGRLTRARSCTTASSRRRPTSSVRTATSGWGSTATRPTCRCSPDAQMGTPEQLVVVVLAVLVVGGLLMVALLWTTLRR